MYLKVVDSLSATGSTDSLLVKEGFVSLSGTWVGSVAIEVDPSGLDAWLPMRDQSGNPIAYTSNQTVAIDSGAPVKTRITFTRTSGTLNAALVGEPG